MAKTGGNMRIGAYSGYQRSSNVVIHIDDNECERDNERFQVGIKSPFWTFNRRRARHADWVVEDCHLSKLFSSSPRAFKQLYRSYNRVLLVDCAKFPWYYRNYTQQILNKTRSLEVISDSDTDSLIAVSDVDDDDCAVVEPAGVEPDVVVDEPGDAVVDPDVVIIEPDDAVVQSDIATVEPDAVVIEPNVAVVEDVVVGNSDAVADSRSVVDTNIVPNIATGPDIAKIEPQPVVNIPEIIIVDPDIVVDEPDSVGVETDNIEVGQDIDTKEPDVLVDPDIIEVESDVQLIAEVQSSKTVNINNISKSLLKNTSDNRFETMDLNVSQISKRAEPKKNIKSSSLNMCQYKKGVAPKSSQNRICRRIREDTATKNMSSKKHNSSIDIKRNTGLVGLKVIEKRTNNDNLSLDQSEKNCKINHKYIKRNPRLKSREINIKKLINSLIRKRPDKSSKSVHNKNKESKTNSVKGKNKPNTPADHGSIHKLHHCSLTYLQKTSTTELKRHQLEQNEPNKVMKFKNVQNECGKIPAIVMKPTNDKNRPQVGQPIRTHITSGLVEEYNKKYRCISNPQFLVNTHLGCHTTSTETQRSVPRIKFTITSTHNTSTNNPAISNTSIPSTSIPSTSIPSTSIPSTSIPITSIAKTSIPRPSFPSTFIPNTSIPSTSISSTSIHITSIPSISIPSPAIPSTSVPSTSISSTSIAKTSIPRPSFPSTFIPNTSIPSTSIPSTFIHYSSIHSTSNCNASISNTSTYNISSPNIVVPATFGCNLDSKMSSCSIFLPTTRPQNIIPLTNNKKQVSPLYAPKPNNYTDIVREDPRLINSKARLPISINLGNLKSLDTKLKSLPKSDNVVTEKVLEIDKDRRGQEKGKEMHGAENNGIQMNTANKSEARPPEYDKSLRPKGYSPPILPIPGTLEEIFQKVNTELQEDRVSKKKLYRDRRNYRRNNIIEALHNIPLKLIDKAKTQYATKAEVGKVVKKDTKKTISFDEYKKRISMDEKGSKKTKETV